MKQRHRWFKVVPMAGAVKTMTRCQLCDAVRYRERKQFAGVTFWRTSYQLYRRNTRKAPACVEQRLL